MALGKLCLVCITVVFLMTGCGCLDVPFIPCI